MVSKIAVMALVAVVAVPILLGYGFNIQTDTYTDWESKTNESVDVSEYLYNVTDTSKRNYTVADPYLFNSNGFYRDDAFVYPMYLSYTSNNTTLPLNGATAYPTGNISIIDSSTQYLQLVVDGGYDANNYYRANITYNDVNQGLTTLTFDYVKVFTYRVSNGSANVYISTLHPVSGSSIEDVRSVSFQLIGTSPGFYQEWNNSGADSFADVSKGWILNYDYPVSTSAASPRSSTTIQPDGICKDMVISFNLDSISSDSYWLGFRLGVGTDRNHIQLFKETISGEVKWYYQIYGDDERHQLFYDPDIPSNTYQLYLNSAGGEFRYVGSWAETIGARPALITYSFSFEDGDYVWFYPDALPRIGVRGQTPHSRIETASVAAYEYRIIRDTTYNPATFKNNPSTELNNIFLYGKSLEFGGVTYPVNSGNITIGTRDMSISKLTFRSEYRDGIYDNFINGILVSSTQAPSTLTFNGDWIMSVITSEQEPVTKDETKWVAGGFGWDGIDTNFIISGLITSLAAFVGLAIYGRRSGAKILPLLLVCGGAAFMFLLML